MTSTLEKHFNAIASVTTHKDRFEDAEGNAIEEADSSDPQTYWRCISMFGKSKSEATTNDTERVFMELAVIRVNLSTLSNEERQELIAKVKPFGAILNARRQQNRAIRSQPRQFLRVDATNDPILSQYVERSETRVTRTNARLLYARYAALLDEHDNELCKVVEIMPEALENYT